MRVKGVLMISKWVSSYKCGYKYVLLNKKGSTYEELVEFRPWRGGVVDRCLVIKEEYVTKNSKLLTN